LKVSETELVPGARRPCDLTVTGKSKMATTQDILAIGWKFLELGDLPRARAHFYRLTQSEPALVEAWYALGGVDQLQGNVSLAIASYARVLELNPDHAPALNNLSVALHSQGKLDAATACLRRAISIKPDYAEAHSNLGNSLKEQGKLEEAIGCYERALELNPDYFDAYNNLGNAHRAQGQLALSVSCYDQALRLKTDHPLVHLSRALSWLQMGDFERGWPEYEWRLHCKEYAIPAFRQARWDGAALKGRPILLYAECGFGDTIQFIRYAPQVSERGGRVIVACKKPIARLVASCPGVEQVVAEGDLLPEFAVYAPLMSLPLILGTTLSTIPARVPYLATDAELNSRWRAETGPPGPFKIGVVWQGNPEYRQDRERSFRLAQLEGIARIPGVRLLSFQRVFGLEQLRETEGRLAVTDLGGRMSDFVDIAAALQSLDLVIAPDTSLAHLAGALGVRVWLALAFAPDSRWLEGRSDSPWYPSIRLFRQKRRGDWEEVFERMAAELRPEEPWSRSETAASHVP
jgi:Tfp pilus assembly protein PilF